MITIGTIILGSLDIGALLIGGMGATVLPKLFGGGKTACSETGVTREQVLASVAKCQAALDAVKAQLS